MALGGLLRNIAAAISAAIVDSLVKGMGYGWCFTGLGMLDVVCVGGILAIMWMRGGRDEFCRFLVTKINVGW